MPFAVADIGALLFAVLCLSVGYSILTFGKFIAALIPSVPIIGSAIRNAILSASEAAGNFLLDLTHASWSRVVMITNDLVYITNFLPSRIIRLFEHHSAQLQTVQHTSIPTAVGVETSNRVNDVNTEEASRKQAIDNVQSDLHSAEVSLQNNINTLGDKTVPAEIETARAGVEHDLSQVSSNLQNNIDSLSRTLVSDLSAVWEAVRPLQTAVSSTIPAELAAEATRANQVIAEAKQAVLSQLSDAITSINGEITTAEGLAASALDRAVQGIDADLNNTIVAEQNALIAAKNDILLQLQTATGKLQGAIDIDNANIGTLQTVTALAIPAAIAAVATGVASITREFEECGVTSCDGPNSLQNQLSKLGGLLSITGELGFLAEAIKDPQGTEEAIQGTLSGLYNTGHSLIDDLLAL